MSNISCGIVGLPNVGKSTLFNALLKKQQALAANYPFATIEPNVGIVPVPDDRLVRLAEITKEEEKMNELPPIKPATVEFVDIAGLVKGAAEGAGLGNKFLSHIREVSVIAHVVRAFEDSNIVREGSVSPKDDYETINTELMLADLNTISKIKDQKSPPKADRPLAEKARKEAADKLFEALSNGIPARSVGLSDEEQETAKDFFLITAKPEIIVLNVSEEQYTEEKLHTIIEEYRTHFNAVDSRLRGNDSGTFVVICAKIESELASLSDDEQKEYLADLGLSASGLERLIQKAYEKLGLISFLTAGAKEVRAWTIRRGMDAQHAAGEIHTDFIKKFIKAEVIGFDDYVSTGGRKKARELGKAGLQGKDYIVQDGDVIEFKIGS